MPTDTKRSRGDIGSIMVIASVPLLGNFEFHVHTLTDQYISRNLLHEKIWEPFETKIFCRLCMDGDFVVDLGANIGWYSVIASQLVGATGRVFSFEPDSTNLELLRRNALASGHADRIEIHGVALADHETESALFLSPTNLGDHRLFSDGTIRNTIAVTVRTLDGVFADSPHWPTLVKSDTQGSEARIVRGASKLLAGGWRPILILEFWPFGLSNSGDDPLALFGILASFGYDIYELTEENPRLIGLSEDRLRVRLTSDLSPQSMAYINLLCLPRGSQRFALIADLVYKA